jgi:hypothetical protein
MQTKTPEIASSDLKAVRQFLTSLREDGQEGRAPHVSPARGVVPLRNGISRARMRSVAKPKA